MKKYLAELIGTMSLVLLGCGAAVISGGNIDGGPAGLGLLGISLAFGLAVVAMAYTIGGISGWTQNSAAFTGVNGVALSSEQFSGPLTWTGKVWVATGAAGNIYTATAPTAFAVGTYTNTQGVVTAVNGGAASGLF